MPDNFTRQNSIVAFITGLEPIAGIVNACLPHFPPVFARLGSSRLASTLSKVFKSGLSKIVSSNSGQHRSSGSYGRDVSSLKTSGKVSRFERLSGSDTMELTAVDK
jgi:hypothetical protein